MKVLIVGAGIGGLTLASFLEYSDIDYTIVEKQNATARQGHSIGLWNNGRHILQKLGLEIDFDNSGHRIHTFSINNGAGCELLRHEL